MELIYQWLVGAVVAVALAIGTFLVLRVFVLWYWKIDEAVSLLASIDQRLAAIEHHAQIALAVEARPVPPADNAARPSVIVDDQR